MLPPLQLQLQVELPRYDTDQTFELFVAFLDKQGCRFTKTMLLLELQHKQGATEESTADVRWTGISAGGIARAPGGKRRLAPN